MCLLPAPHTHTHTHKPFYTLSLSPLPITNSTPPPLCFSLCHGTLFPPFPVLGARVLARLQETWCQIGGPCARWHTLSQWLEKERKRETELERKRGKKATALGFASGRAHSSNIDSLFLFCFFFLLRPSAPPVSSPLSPSMRVVHVSIEPIACAVLPTFLVRCF